MRKSDAMPGWVDSRVWFSLQKLARARTQHSGSASEMAQMLTMVVHSAENLAHLDAERDQVGPTCAHSFCR